MKVNTITECRIRVVWPLSRHHYVKALLMPVVLASDSGFVKVLTDGEKGQMGGKMFTSHKST